MPRGQKERPWQPAEGKCIRADVLRGIQPRLAAVALDGARGLLRRSPDRKNRARPALAHGMHDTTPQAQPQAHAAACAVGAVMPATPQLSQSIPSTWHAFSGPIHLNTIGSAHIACLVHAGLFRRCAAQCDGNLNLTARMASRHEQLRREEPLPTLALDELEQRLHASGVTVSGDDSGNVGRLERSGFREPYRTRAESRKPAPL